MPNRSDNIRPLDGSEGHILSDADRKFISLPVRLGGLGIPIYQEISTCEYEFSRKGTSLLTPRFVAQEQTYVIDKVNEKKK